MIAAAVSLVGRDALLAVHTEYVPLFVFFRVSSFVKKCTVPGTLQDHIMINEPAKLTNLWNNAFSFKHLISPPACTEIEGVVPRVAPRTYETRLSMYWYLFSLCITPHLRMCFNSIFHVAARGGTGEFTLNIVSTLIKTSHATVDLRSQHGINPRPTLFGVRKKCREVYKGGGKGLIAVSFTWYLDVSIF